MHPVHPTLLLGRVQYRFTHFRRNVTPNFLDGLVIVLDRFQPFQHGGWDRHAAVFRHPLETLVALDGHNAGQYRTRDAIFSTSLDVIQEGLHIVKELRQYEISPGIDLGLEVHHLLFQAGTGRMALGMTGDGNAKVRPVQVSYQPDQIDGPCALSTAHIIWFPSHLASWWITPQC